MGEQQYRITVRGRVQGVFFRGSARRRASALGLRGLARNNPDGTVYLEAEGAEGALAEFLAWCHAGPPSAEVEQVQYTRHPASGHRGFRVE